MQWKSWCWRQKVSFIQKADVMRGISFDYSSPVSEPDTHRMDVACFIGFVSLNKGGFISDALKQWWKEHGWRDTESGELDLMDRPIPVESWDAFKTLFDDRRLTHQAQVQSHALTDPLPVAEDDTHLHLIVDYQSQKIKLEPNAGSLELSELVDQLNNAFDEQLKGSVEAEIDSRSGTSTLVLKRTDRQTAGELTVYSNPSLGFPYSIQDDDDYLDNYLASAVRAFFRLGGRKCYIIPMGSPLPYLASETAKFKQVLQLFWGSALTERLYGRNKLKLEDLIDFPLPGLVDGTQNMEKRQSLTHLMDLTDVTYVCFPDLVELFTSDITAMEKRPEEKKEEVFVACSHKERALPWFYSQPYQAPLISRENYGIWKRFIDLTLEFLDTHAPNTQLIASLPLPDHAAQKNFETFVVWELLETEAEKDDLYRRLQLVFPWLKTDQSEKLPESAEPPEGTLTGLLASGAILKGAYRSIAGSLVDSAYDLMPLNLNMDAYTPLANSGLSFCNRISFLDFVPSGIELQSDVTAVNTPSYQYAVVRRIMILVQRAAHAIGLNYVFEASAQRTWQSIEDTLSDLLMKIYQKNGLWGATPNNAFSVVCDRTTMTQNDIDNGRYIVNITLQPAVPIEHIKVDMMIQRGSVTESV